MSQCNQCEQANQGTGCTLGAVSHGVCGKNEDIQSLQETLVYGLKGMSAYASHARRLGASDPEVDAFVQEALFSTMTNVNFDLGATLEYVLECGRMNLRVMQHARRGSRPGHGQARPDRSQRGHPGGPRHAHHGP